MKPGTTQAPIRATITVLYSILFAIGMSLVTYLLIGLSTWGDGGVPTLAAWEIVFLYGLIPGGSLATSLFIGLSPFRREKGLVFTCVYWMLFASFTLVAGFCLLTGDGEALMFGIPTAIFLPAWYPFRRTARRPADPTIASSPD